MKVKQIMTDEAKSVYTESMRKLNKAGKVGYSASIRNWAVVDGEMYIDAINKRPESRKQGLVNEYSRNLIARCNRELKEAF